MNKQVQVYELEGTNLLYVVTDLNSDATYYSKTNLTVEAVNGYVVIYNSGAVVLRELPRDFVNPLESSVVDLVEIIQGYINNLLPVVDNTVIALGEIIAQNAERNLLLEEIRKSNIVLNHLGDLLIEQNIYLKEMF